MMIVLEVCFMKVGLVCCVQLQICIGSVEVGLNRFFGGVLGKLCMKVIMLISKSGVVLLSVCVRLMIVLVRMFGMVSGSIW